MSWNRSQEKPEISEVTGTSNARWLYAVLALVVLGGGIWLYVATRPQEREEARIEERPSRIKAVTPAKAPQAEPVKATPKADEKSKVRAKIAKMSKEEKEDLAWQMLKEKPLDLTPRTNQPFRTSLELQLARIFTTQLGNRPPPPLPPIAPREMAHLTEILIADNPQLETDSEEVRIGKEALKLAKQEMRKYIKEGGDPDNFVNHYYGVLNDAFQERRMCMQELMNAAKNTPEIAGELVESYNKRLSEKGIRTIELSDKVRQKLGIE